MIYYSIPETILKDNSLTPATRLVYAVIHKYAQNGRADYCWASNKTLAVKFDVSSATIQRSISDLRKAGYIRLEFVKGKTRKIFPQLCVPIGKNSTYSKQLRHDKWLERKKQILKRDDYKCTKCGSSLRLHVHHLAYAQSYSNGRFVFTHAWEYPDDLLLTLCHNCHKDTKEPDYIVTKH